MRNTLVVCGSALVVSVSLVLAQGGPATRPFSVDVGELFRIKDGQIRKVDALMVSLPYGQQNPFVPKK